MFNCVAAANLFSEPPFGKSAQVIFQLCPTADFVLSQMFFDDLVNYTSVISVQNY